MRGSSARMILPDGYSDVPAGKIAAVVTHLEMTARPALRPDPPGAWTLAPGRDSRSRLVSRSLSPRRRGMAVVFAAADDGCRTRRDHPLAAGGSVCAGAGRPRRRPAGAGFSRSRPMRTGVLRRHRKTDRQRRRALADEPRAGAGVVAAGRAGLGAYLHAAIIRRAVAFYQRSGFRPFRRQVEIADDPRLDGTVPRSAARHVPIIE